MEAQKHGCHDTSNAILRLCNILAMLRVVRRSLLQQEFGGDEETTLEVTIKNLQDVYNFLDSEGRQR
jgi:hypothetical protein